MERPKFDRVTLLRNVNRIKVFMPKGSTIQKVKQTYTDIIAWTEPARTVKFFIFYMFFIYYFQLWWVPAAALVFLIINFRNRSRRYIPSPVTREESVEEEEEEEEDKEEKKSLKQSLDSLQNTLQEVQEGCGVVASYMEKIVNMANFEEVFLSVLSCILLLGTSLVLVYFGLRSVLLLWGVCKFTKKLRGDPIPTNEVDNLINRVPDFELLEDCRDLSPNSTPGSPS